MIDAKRLEEITVQSLFTEKELNENPEIKETATKGECIRASFGFHPERIESHRAEVIAMLRELDLNFYESKGGGWSFLNLPFDKNGNQWGEQSNADMLLLISNALGLMKIQMPREMWKLCPGGVPYVVVFDKKLEANNENN